MPSISRARIVNFFYNDGTRFIPDEIFDFSDSEGNTLDTLLDLENGGGKTVLVQLLLQPVIPCARVQARRISEYFRKSTDCAYILLEWKLDRSSDRLLTGIAMTAGQNDRNDPDENRTVKYYTFINHYGFGGDKYDIVNFPLSETAGGRFIPAQFEKVRSMAKALEYYHSEDIRKYQSRLDEFGIIHSEWENILVRINEREGGIEQFIEGYNTTDKLLDRFIIPGITSGKGTGDGADGSVDAMFLNYAESCGQMSEKIAQRKRIDEFIGQLGGFVPQAKELWALYDENQSSVRQLFDYIVSLKDALSNEKTRLEQLYSDMDAAEKQKLHIELERLSHSWYRDKASEENELQLAEEYAHKTEKANLGKEKAEHMIKVLHAAERYSQLTEKKAEQAELKTQLRKLTDASFDEHIRSVRYSLHIAAEKLLSDTAKRLEELTEKISINLSEINSLTDKQNELSSESAVLRSETDKLRGQKELLEKDIFGVMSEMNIIIAKMLDGSFDKKEIEAVRVNINSEINDRTAENESLSEKYKGLEEAAENNRKRISELIIESGNVKREHEKITAELAAYDEKYNAVCEVLKALSMGEEAAFTDGPENELISKIAELNDAVRASERKSESLSEQLLSAENGNVHIPQSAVDFLYNSGIDYQTGTAYLSEHRELCGKILETEPLAAFSVIVDDEKARRALYDSIGSDSWISAAIPIFTLSEISDIADGKKICGSEFLAVYSREYFADRAAYIRRITERIQNAHNELQLLNEKLDERKKQLSVIGEFDYPEKYKSDKLAEQKHLSVRLDDIDKELCAAREENVNIARSQRNIIERQKEISAELPVLKQKMSRFDELYRKMNEYYTAEAAVSKNEEKLRSLKRQQDLAADKLQELTASAEELKNAYSLHSVKKEEYLTTLSETEGEAAELLSEPYEELKAQYDACVRKYTEDKQTLYERLESCGRKISQLTANLEKTGISKEEYSTAEYSEEAVSREESAKAAAEKEWKEMYRQQNVHEGALRSLREKISETENMLRKYNSEVLSRSEIGTDFDIRIKECSELTERLRKKIIDVSSKMNRHNDELKRSEKIAEKYHDNYETHRIIPITDNMTEDIRSGIDSSEKRLRAAEANALGWIRDNLSGFSECGIMFKNIASQLEGFIRNETDKDKYFTMYEKLERDMQTLEKQRSRLDTELEDIERSRKELVSHCMQRIKVLYDDLKNLSKKSSVKIFDRSRAMISIKLPEIAQDDTASKTRMEQYIDSCAREFLEGYEESDIRAREQSAHKYMNFRRLLNSYIGQDEIPVYVYKIGNSAQTSSYRKWETALKANSGGERFVVFFALILSMMNYSRSIANSMKDSSGVLILDNPFGPISSAHLLTPMFEIARKFKIQLICFTHLDTAEIMKCFRCSYKLKLKARPLSSIETLEAEPLQALDHAFYRTEQLSFL